ncbi:MANSC domain-containing protein 1-like [Coregonus clupeaformis]|uniref:MANSC domain-containing protein 1-like n=1 Tax=Coregonus clupeaformis TaxID=59861 RepID=UPI001E1C940A|nr:MANSC domain-containing protein 1-like [Coregonus clupeaformis]
MIPTVTRILPSRVSSPLLLVTMLMLAAAGPVSGSDAETCFSRQHQNATVNVRQALARPTTVMDSRVAQSERDCVLACCSEDVKPGITCTLAVFNPHKPSEPPNNHNCHLFHCQNEQDCPLLAAEHGINTYDIFKDTQLPPLQHQHPIETQLPPLQHQHPIETQLPPLQHQHPIETQLPALQHQHPIETQLPPLQHQHPIDTQLPPLQHQHPVDTQLPSLQHQHPVDTQLPSLQHQHPVDTQTPSELLKDSSQHTTTTTTTTTTAATTTTMTPAAIEPLNPRTTPEKDLLLVPKGVQADPFSPGTEGQGGGKEVAGRGALKSSLVAVVVVGLAILTLALAVVGRKAMESFDRRHYTRLELNDLHYEV